MSSKIDSNLSMPLMPLIATEVVTVNSEDVESNRLAGWSRRFVAVQSAASTPLERFEILFRYIRSSACSIALETSVAWLKEAMPIETEIGIAEENPFSSR